MCKICGKPTRSLAAKFSIVFIFYLSYTTAATAIQQPSAAIHCEVIALVLLQSDLEHAS
jgi:hypothetical protein